MTTELDDWIKERRDRLWQCPNGQYAVQAGYILSGFGQHRDSDARERTNWETAQRMLCETAGQEWSGLGDIACFSYLGDQIFTDAVIYGSWGQWGAGWVEELLIREDNAEVVQQAFELHTYVTEQYPVLDDGLHSEIEWADNHPDDLCYSDDECDCGRTKA